MPELPEVETVARQLVPCLVGRRVRRLDILDPLLEQERTPQVRGRRVLSVERSGKRVVIELAPPGSGGRRLWLAVHLRMTGRLIWDPDGGGEGRAHLRARAVLDRGALLFLDARRFGTFSWYFSREAVEPVGLDPLSDKMTPVRLAALLRGSSQPLKAWLLRQDRLVGLGNIYASEILHEARLSPFRAAGSLDGREVRRLCTATRRILERAVRHCGTTFSDFQDARGVEGSFQHFLAVYDRAGEPCRRCRVPVGRIVQQQRSTYYCPGCQA